MVYCPGLDRSDHGTSGSHLSVLWRGMGDNGGRESVRQGEWTTAPMSRVRWRVVRDLGGSFTVGSIVPNSTPYPSYKRLFWGAVQREVIRASSLIQISKSVEWPTSSSSIGGCESVDAMNIGSIAVTACSRLPTFDGRDGSGHERC